MANNETIFDLQQSKEDTQFIINNAELEFEITADIIEHADDIPYIGSLLKIGKIAINYINYRFYRRLARFLKHANEIPENEITSFIQGLSLKDKKRISDYLTQILYTVEEDCKADLMGKIYKRFVLSEIDIDMLLRLCSIINRAYITDISYLGDYLEVSEKNTYITDNLVSLGILAESGNLYENNRNENDGPSIGPTKHTLNEIGITLYQILTDQKIAKIPIKRITEKSVLFRSISTEELDKILT